MIAATASRNDPCPCGSGKRYKNCHGAFGAVPPPPPADSGALWSAADALFDRGDFAGSALAYDRLFAQGAEQSAELWVRRGVAQEKSGQLAAAETSYREAALLAPDHAEIYANLGSVCVQQGRHAEADAALSRALALDPGDAYALAMLAHTRQHRCAWTGLDSLFSTLRNMLDDPVEPRWPVVPFPLLAMPLSPQQLLTASRQWARRLQSRVPVAKPTLHRAPGERLRIGFVSSDFRLHATPVLMTELWERLDRGRIEAFAYGILPEDRGPIGRRIRSALEHFADVSAETDAAIAQRIREDRVAIVFDLNGYTTHARSEIFALRPAPLQINYVGYPGTLGAEWYDYIIVDRHLAPPTLQPYFTERFLAMPHSHYPSDTTRAPKGPAPTRVECGLPAQGFVFCSFNATYKILPPVFAIWMRLLRSVPGSVLWLLESNGDAKSNLRQEASRAGIAPERLIFAPPAPNREHVARNATADLFLDTAPCGAHTTANDALLAGLPVLTCPGPTLASRFAASQLHAIGLPELVCANFADYEALALRLARQPAELAALRARLDANRMTEPLFDMARYARDFEDLLMHTWDAHAGGARG